ncbi:hypothetical protein C8A00DRAFT_46742 [Chaetomidium leptoderma]|uniref:Uncharacterized protein n=1 Tax=Chaetomidium leptoderma TaxID=669021 RepID=A0AAN6ZSV0_9PEZI|nr:hypothetical protein C8A00DRAFT_46742 [Chaetomidium leptoderma]
MDAESRLPSCSRDENLDCRAEFKLPSSIRESTVSRYVILAVLAIGLGLAAVFFGVTMAVIARYVATDNTGFEPENPEFALYKNSRFKECYNLVPDATNCSAIRSGLGALATRIPEGFGYVDRYNGWNTFTGDEYHAHPPIYDWCQIVSCFNGFKIIPSTARPSATILSTMACWWAVMMTSASALGHTGKQIWAAFSKKRQKPCRGLKELSIFDWVLLAYDICGPIFWWWLSFGQFAADPTMSTTLAITTWVTTWKLASVVRFHPYSCALPGGRRAKRNIIWALHAMTVLQWAAGVYVMVVYLGDLSYQGSTLQSYDCVASRIPDAPGSTSCSVADLCSKATLFRGAEFTYEDTYYVGGRYNLIAYFWIWTLMALMPFIFLLMTWKAKEDLRDTWRVFNPGPSVYLTFASFISLAYAVAYAVNLVQTWNSPRDREGPFTFHPECNALHVPLSPWRDYFDLGEYARAYRIAKMVFNA